MTCLLTPYNDTWRIVPGPGSWITARRGPRLLASKSPISAGSLPNHELNAAPLDRRHSRQQCVYPCPELRRSSRVAYRARPSWEHSNRHLGTHTQRNHARVARQVPMERLYDAGCALEGVVDLQLRFAGQRTECYQGGSR